MRVLICGSREWRDKEAVERVIRKFDAGTIIIHGNSTYGVDRLADETYVEYRTVIRYPADWNQYGKRAGFVRNMQMLDTNPDEVHAFWNGTSKGTLHTINGAKKRNIPIFIYEEYKD